MPSKGANGLHPVTLLNGVIWMSLCYYACYAFMKQEAIFCLLDQKYLVYLTPPVSATVEERVVGQMV